MVQPKGRFGKKFLKLECQNLAPFKNDGRSSDQCIGWWDQMQAIFSNLIYFNKRSNFKRENLALLKKNKNKKKIK